jgi:hypothetical protein
MFAARPTTVIGGVALIHRFFAALAFAALSFGFSHQLAIAATSPTIVAQASMPALFASPDSAQAHCTRDVVVWLNIPSGIYHYQGERWYGRTKHGAYVCEKEAIAAGDRATRNGQ